MLRGNRRISTQKRSHKQVERQNMENTRPLLCVLKPAVKGFSRQQVPLVRSSRQVFQKTLDNETAMFMGIFLTNIGTAVRPVTLFQIIGYQRARKEWPPRAYGHFSTPFVRITNVKQPQKRMVYARADAATSPDSKPQNVKIEQLDDRFDQTLQKKSNGESRRPTKARVAPVATTKHRQRPGSQRGQMPSAGLSG